jgi:non-ribosomal peptide synthetase component F
MQLTAWPPDSLSDCPALQLLHTLAKQGITHLTAVPSLWKALAASLQRATTSRSSKPSSSSVLPALRLRVAVSSGEPLPAGLLEQLQQLLPLGCHIWNLYGSTEVAADCTAFDCTKWRPQAGQYAVQQVPVGHPISCTLLAVLAQAGPEQAADSAATDAAVAGQRALLPLGQVGEVAVAGAGLAAGYLCQQQAAASAAQLQRFVQLPTSQLEQAQLAGALVAVAADLPAAFWREDSTQLFLTGDMGWLDASGCLHLAGRRDLQVKIAGGGDARVACIK